MRNEIKTVSVLVIDDDQSEVVKIRGYAAQMPGFRLAVKHAQTDEEGIRVLRNNVFDLVFLDYQIRPRDGLLVLNDLLSLAANVPVIVLSGAGNERTAVEAMKAGATDYIVKADLSVHSLERAVIHAIETREKQDIIRRQQEILRSLARTDDLTGVWNRRYFMERMTWQMRMARRYLTPQTFCMCDIDHFKEVNDTYGHLVGDDVLRVTARSLSGGLRDIDLIGRYGGEEFSILLVNTELQQGIHVAERLRKRVRELVFDGGQGRTFSIAVSFGVAQNRPDQDTEDLIHRADAAMYEAKNAGRDCIRAYSPSDVLPPAK